MECFSAEFYNKSIIRKNNLVFNACKFVTLKYTICSGYSWFPLIWGEAHLRIGGSKLRQVILRFCFIKEALRLSFRRPGSHYSYRDSAGNGTPRGAETPCTMGTEAFPKRRRITWITPSRALSNSDILFLNYHNGLLSNKGRLRLLSEWLCHL